VYFINRLSQGTIMRKLTNLLIGGAFSLAMATAAQATVVSLNFEGVNATYPSGYANVLEFYNGGLSSDGTTGTNYGVSFGRNALAICLNSTSVSCSNTSRGGLGDPNSQKGALFFLDGTETFLNYAAGFTTGFSFNYVSFSFAGSVGVFDGLNGTGNLLATLNLSPNAGSCPGYGAGFCPFSPTGVNFAGTGRSIAFGGVANQIVFDDVTFGSSTPGPGVPEPATWAMLITGFGLVGGAMRRRQSVSVTYA
jgi:hypothetical protein